MAMDVCLPLSMISMYRGGYGEAGVNKVAPPTCSRVASHSATRSRGTCKYGNVSLCLGQIFEWETAGTPVFLRQKRREAAMAALKGYVASSCVGVLLMMYASCKYTMLSKSLVRQVDHPSVRNVNLLGVVSSLVPASIPPNAAARRK